MWPETVQLKPKDINTARGVLRIREGKGGKIREISICPGMILRLRKFWKQHGNRLWLFPATGRGWQKERRSRRQAMATAKSPMSTSSLQNAVRVIRVAARINKPVTPTYTAT